jgi:mono/diheme cytochrome c family protein
VGCTKGKIGLVQRVMAAGRERRDGERRRIYRLYAGLAVAALLMAGCGGRSASALEANRLSEGKALYEQNCAACHGISGEGQPNWKTPDDNGVYPAPPHDSSGHTWHHPDAQLLEIIATGGMMPNSTMTGFADRLSEEEMRLTLEYIQTFWGKQEREYQAEVTRQFKAQNP